MTYHITPLNDLKPHIEESTCECEPDIKFENGHMLVIHNSYDGREGLEEAKEVLNETE